MEAQQAQADQQQAQIDKDTKAYADAADQYNQNKDDFEAAQAQSQQQIQAHNEQTAQYQQKATEYNAKQQELNYQTQQLAEGIQQYNAGQTKYQAGLKQVNEGLSTFKQGLSTYQQAIAKYDPKTATTEDYAQLEENHRQLLNGQAQLKSGMTTLEYAQNKLQSVYAQLQTVAKQIQSADTDSSADATLKAQQQTLLAEVTQLTTQQDALKVDSDRAQALLSTYDQLTKQLNELDSAREQLNQLDEDITSEEEVVEIAQMRADADQQVADDAKMIAQSNLSSTIHEWIEALQRASAGDDGMTETTSPADAVAVSTPVKETTAATTAHESFAISQISLPQFTSTMIESPIDLVAPTADLATLPSFETPETFVPDAAMNTEIILPEAPLTKPEQTVTVSVPREIKVLDADSGDVVLALTIEPDGVAISLPAGYQLAAKQSENVQPGEKTTDVTVKFGDANAVVYVQTQEQSSSSTNSSVTTSSAATEHQENTAPVESVSGNKDHNIDGSNENSQAKPSVEVSESDSNQPSETTSKKRTPIPRPL